MTQETANLLLKYKNWINEAVQRLKTNFGINIKISNETIKRCCGPNFRFTVTHENGAVHDCSTSMDKNGIIYIPLTLCQKYGWNKDDPKVLSLSPDQQNVIRFAIWLFAHYHHYGEKPL